MPIEVNAPATFGGFRTSARETFFSSIAAFLIPVILGLYWPLYASNPDLAIFLLRPAIVGTCAILAVLWYKAPLTRAELQTMAIMAFFCALWLLPSLFATILARAMTDWIKLVAICFASLLVARGLRNEASAKAFGWGLMLSSLILAIFIFAVYLRYMGLTIPTYESARVFKGVAATANISLNAIGFGSVFAYIAGMCLIRARFSLWLLGFVLFIVASVFTGSRTPLVVLVTSGAALILLNGLRSRRMGIRLASYLVSLVVAAWLVFGLPQVSFKAMSQITEGRWDLWSVGWAKFTERPVFGYGYESWRDDLVSRLPGEYEMTGFIAEHIAGGYHSEYVTILAEEGLVGVVPALLLVGYLVWASWVLAFRRPVTWKHGQWALFGTLFVLFRAGVEAPGLFGYSQEPADFLAYFFISIVISRLSVEEMYQRALRPAQKSAPVKAKLVRT